MKVGNIAMGLILAGCPLAEQDTGLDNDFPLESVSCTHPDSDYEAVLRLRSKTIMDGRISISRFIKVQRLGIQHCGHPPRTMRLAHKDAAS